MRPDHPGGVEVGLRSARPNAAKRLAQGHPDDDHRAEQERAYHGDKAVTFGLEKPGNANAQFVYARGLKSSAARFVRRAAYFGPGI